MPRHLNPHEQIIVYGIKFHRDGLDLWIKTDMIGYMAVVNKPGESKWTCQAGGTVGKDGDEIIKLLIATHHEEDGYTV